MMKAILFDADGVTIHTTERFSACLEREYGISREMTNSFFLGVFQDCIVRKADLKEEIGRYLPVWGWKKSVDDFLHYWFESEHKIHQPLIDEIYKLRKHGIKCYLATNQEKYRMKYILKNMEFENVFDGAFSSSDVGHMKRAGEYFRHIFSKLHGVRPDEMILWDDDMRNIATAKQMGLHAEFYTSFEDFQKKMKIYIANR